MSSQNTSNDIPSTAVPDVIKYQAETIANEVWDENYIRTMLNQMRNEMQASFDDLKASVDGLQTLVTKVQNDLTARLVSTERTSAITYNMSVGDGENFSFKIVLFPDGSDPVTEHNLPALQCTADIQNLSGEDLTKYYTQYVGPPTRSITVEMRQKGVCKAIGAFL